MAGKGKGKQRKKGQKRKGIYMSKIIGWDGEERKGKRRRKKGKRREKDKEEKEEKEKEETGKECQGRKSKGYVLMFKINGRK